MQRLWFLVLCLACAAPKPQTQETTIATSSNLAANLLQNSDFSAWQGESPEHWKISDGAGGGEVASRVSRAPSGVLLSGDSNTTRWELLTQEFAVKPGGWYSLRFEASVAALQQGPFINHWVGVAFFDQTRKRISIEIASLEEGEAAAQSLSVKAPEEATTAQVQLFLSQPGELAANNFSLYELASTDSFAILVDDMARKYSFFALKQIDWKPLSEKYQSKANSAKSPQEFAAVVVQMLSELNDVHISVTPPSKEVIYTVTKHPAANIDFATTQKQLTDMKPIGKTAVTATLAGGFGYFAISSMLHEAEFLKAQSAFEPMLANAGLVIDLRGNIGGAEKLGNMLVGALTDQQRIYSKVAYRIGVSFDRFTAPLNKVLMPSGKGYPGKIAVLIGPACASSCEGMTMMLKSLPNAKLFGQATRGASGSPQPITLPNGVTVSYSRWKAMLPDESPIEAKGISPDVTIEHKAGADPTLDAALTWLQGK